METCFDDYSNDANNSPRQSINSLTVVTLYSHRRIFRIIKKLVSMILTYSRLYPCLDHLFVLVCAMDGTCQTTTFKLNGIPSLCILTDISVWRTHYQLMADEVRLVMQ